MNCAVDDKILTSWNGLAIYTLALAFQALKDQELLIAAQTTAKFIEQRLWKDGKLLKFYINGQVSEGEGTIDDYAYLIKGSICEVLLLNTNVKGGYLGLILLYSCDFNGFWIKWAVELQQYLETHFADKDQSKNGGYFMTSDISQVKIISRTKNWFDSSTPNGASMTVDNLLRLATLECKEEWQQRAQKLIEEQYTNLATTPELFMELVLSLEVYLDPIEIVLEGDNVEKWIEVLWSKFLPNAGAFLLLLNGF